MDKIARNSPLTDQNKDFIVIASETLDVNGGRAALLARGVVTLEAALGLTDGLLNGHQGDVTLPVVHLGSTVAVRCPIELL